MTKKILTGPEWTMMNALWGKPPQVLSEIIDAVDSKEHWSYYTYSSYMRILCEKGYVTYTVRGRMKFYSAAIDREDCIRSEGRNLIDKMNNANAEQLLLYMAKSVELSEQTKQELKSLIERLESEKK